MRRIGQPVAAFVVSMAFTIASAAAQQDASAPAAGASAAGVEYGVLDGARVAFVSAPADEPEQWTWRTFREIGAESFYYRPASVQRDGPGRIVDWTSNRMLAGEEPLISRIEINCALVSSRIVSLLYLGRDSGRVLRRIDFLESEFESLPGRSMGVALHRRVCFGF